VFPCNENKTNVYKDTCFPKHQMMSTTTESADFATHEPIIHETMATQTARKIPHNGPFKGISFEAVTPGLLVRTTDDGHLLALDFISTLTNGDRKKASQTLARVASHPDMSSLLCLRRVICKPKPRKLLSFSNAVQLLLVLPKRTVSMDIRRAVAGVLTDYFEYRHQEKQANKPPPSPGTGVQLPQFQSSFLFMNEEEKCVSLQRAKVDLTHKEVELERQRMRMPLDRLNHCMELMERCGPLSEEEQRKFKSLITEQAVGSSGSLNFKWT
jgi:hypothetical protein